MNGTAKDWAQEVFIQISETQVGRAIRTKRWKYSVWAPERKGNRDSGSDVAIMCLLGYSPRQYHSGRAPLEALRQAVAAGFADYAKFADDKDLDSLRGDSDFKSLIAELKARFGPVPLKWDRDRPAPEFAVAYGQAGRPLSSAILLMTFIIRVTDTNPALFYIQPARWNSGGFNLPVYIAAGNISRIIPLHPYPAGTDQPSFKINAGQTPVEAASWGQVKELYQ